MVKVLQDAGFEVLMICVFDVNVGLYAGYSVGVDAFYFDNEDILAGFTCFCGSEGVRAAGSEHTFNIHAVARKPLKVVT